MFDTAIAETGLLLDGDHLTTSLSDNLLALALQANRGKGTEPLEEALEDFISLGERFNWDQLCAFSEKITDLATQHQHAASARSADERLPAIYAAVQLSGDPAAAGKYITQFSHTGLQDMTTALCYGADGERALVRSQQRVVLAGLAALDGGARSVRWLLLLCGCLFFGPSVAHAGGEMVLLPAYRRAFLFATAMYVNLPVATPLERPLHVRGVGRVPKDFICVGFSVDRAALERAVSRPGAPGR